MLQIDGSIGEGGGQILRTAISLASLLEKPVKIYNIRAKRSKPGLKLQHATGIRAAAEICDAEIEGVEINSTEIVYKPQKMRGGNFKIDMKTAGSISLILQVLMPILAFSPEKSTLSITGGTDVNWSPPINYLQNIIKPILSKMKYEFDLKIIKRGHYPKGGGKVIANFLPVKFLNSLKVLDYEGITKIKGISHCVKLPKHVAFRQKDAAISYLRKNNFSGAEIELEYYKKEEDPHLGAGSGIVLWAIPDNDIPIGGDCYGARGKRAEKVGEEAVNNLMKELKTRASVDIHTCDILIPYLGLAKGRSIIRVRKLSNHIKTNIKITQKILKNKFRIKEIDKDLFEIEVDGISFQNKYKN